MVAAAKIAKVAPTASNSELHRVVGWKDAFWVASGVPALVLFSIGGIAATVGTPSVLVWTLSVLFGYRPGLHLCGGSTVRHARRRHCRRGDRLCDLLDLATQRGAFAPAGARSGLGRLANPA